VHVRKSCVISVDRSITILLHTGWHAIYWVYRNCTGCVPGSISGDSLDCSRQLSRVICPSLPVLKRCRKCLAALVRSKTPPANKQYHRLSSVTAKIPLYVVEHSTQQISTSKQRQYISIHKMCQEASISFSLVSMHNLQTGSTQPPLKQCRARWGQVWASCTSGYDAYDKLVSGAHNSYGLLLV